MKPRASTYMLDVRLARVVLLQRGHPVLRLSRCQTGPLCSCAVPPPARTYLRPVAPGCLLRLHQVHLSIVYRY